VLAGEYLHLNLGSGVKNEQAGAVEEGSQETKENRPNHLPKQQ
jgi:hypothetical protein